MVFNRINTANESIKSAWLRTKWCYSAKTDFNRIEYELNLTDTYLPFQKLVVSMTKHPSSFKLNGQLAEDNSRVTDQPVVLYEGPVRPLCSLAPNNVNTMAAASVAAHNLGLDLVIGRLVSDPK